MDGSDQGSGVRQILGDAFLVRALAELAAEVVARLAGEHPAVQNIRHKQLVATKRNSKVQLMKEWTVFAHVFGSS